jgi:hypothetical protein
MPSKKVDVTRKAGSTFRLDADLVAAMKALHERDGILPSEQVRRALRPWLEEKGVLPKSKRKHP